MNRAPIAVWTTLTFSSLPGCSSHGSESARPSVASTTQQARVQLAHACLAVPPDLQTACPVERGRVLAVKAVREAASPKGRETLVGATIYVPASPGTSAEWLGRRIGCYQARMNVEPPPSASTGCPFAYPGSKVRVDGTSDGFAVTVKSNDLASAHRILETSETLAATL